MRCVPRQSHLLRQRRKVESHATEASRLIVGRVVRVEHVQNINVDRVAPRLQGATRRAAVLEGVELLQLDALADEAVQIWSGNLSCLDCPVPPHISPADVLRA